MKLLHTDKGAKPKASSFKIDRVWPPYGGMGATPASLNGLDWGEGVLWSGAFLRRDGSP
jgi:hypothetical protein